MDYGDRNSRSDSAVRTGCVSVFDAGMAYRVTLRDQKP